MRRWFAILLLVLLPLQFSWAAVAAYCGHESAVQEQHLGHHEHPHAGHASADKGAHTIDQSGETASVDFDCGHCHSTCCSLPAQAGTLTPPGISSHPVTPVAGSARTLAQTPPERPQWLRFA